MSGASSLLSHNTVAAWDALADICRRENISHGELLLRVESRGHPGGRTNAVRSYVSLYYRNLRTEQPAAMAG
jgi:hypothetical protein